MARTSTKTTVPAPEPRVNEAAMAVLDAAPRELLATQDSMDEVLAAGIDLGRLEAMDFMATVANSATLSIYENVKKSKAWRHLRNPKSGDGSHFLSLDEFCEIKLGKSYKRLRDIAANRNAIGQEAFEQAERLGLHQRDYNAIKSLPAPDQELIRRAVEEAQSRDEVLDLLQELAARHAKVKETLTKDLLQSEQDSKFNAEKREKAELRADTAEKQLAGKRPVVVPLDERITPFQVEIAERQSLLEKCLLAHDQAIEALDVWWTAEVTSAPDYDPEQEVPMPPSVLAVVQHLYDGIERTAALVGGLQHRVWLKFGDAVPNARQYLLQDPAGDGSGGVIDAGA